MTGNASWNAVPRTSIGKSGAACGRSIAASAPSTSARIPPSSRIIVALGNSRVSDASLSSNVSRQMPFEVAAISISPIGLSKVVQRIVSPRPPSRQAEGVIPILSFASA